MSRLHLISLTVVALSTLAGVANAGPSATTDVACGYRPANWDAPAGALVSDRGEGPVTAIIDAIGEVRTHSMFSHGAWYASHATMHTPGQNGWPTYCDLPMNTSELRYGYPGASRITTAALYEYLYEGTSPEFLYFQVPYNNCQGQGVSTWLQSQTRHTSVAGSLQGSQSFSRYWYGGSPIVYSTYQFRTVGSTSYGGVGTDNGMVCSSFASWAMYNSNTSGGYVPPYTYNNAQLTNGLNALYNAVYRACDNGMGFWTGVGAAASCMASIIYFDNDICDDAARQVTNCFAQDRCDSSDSNWQNLRNSTATAIAVSPDRVAGYGVHTNSGSIWAGAPSQTVHWSGSTTYGCWF